MKTEIRTGQEADHSDIEDRATKLLTTITDKILRQYKLDDISDLAITRASSTQQTRSVVVVGEVKRGKSSLVNAIVGKRNASPVGVNVTTSTAIALTSETDELQEGQACLFYPNGEKIVRLNEVGEWING